MSERGPPHDKFTCTSAQWILTRSRRICGRAPIFAGNRLAKCI